MTSGADEEAVTVNTRALVDKILARYSGEYTTIRELIQNAADAKAGKVTIRLETRPSPSIPVPHTTEQSALLKHTISHHTMSRMVISNNGEAFGAADWARLKRIAEGNPDETKIGAFGVGFYSVFADCEEPFVVSGKRTMAFYWKNNGLFTKSGEMPADQPSADTQFLLNYRSDDAAVPDLLALCTFLTTSLTFVDLQEIQLMLDDWNILTLKKKRADGVTVPISSDINTKTADGMMKIVSVVNQSTQIDAQWMNVLGWKVQQHWQTIPAKVEKASQAIGGISGLFQKFAKSATGGSAARAAREKEAAASKAIEEDVVGFSRATAFLRISTVNVQTYVKPQFARDLERATKKPPPKHTRIEILSSSFDEASAFAATISGKASNKAADLFASVLTAKSGRVFIGFPTKQTTGLLCHISAPSVIPTVEREAIDLNADAVRVWNQEMLRVAGIACRIAYDGDMAHLRKDLLQRAAGKPIDQTLLDTIIPSALHTLKQYTATETTPDARVGKLIQGAFWSCGSASMEIVSTKGVLPCTKVRILSQKLSFLENIASVPDILTKEANDFIYKLVTSGYLTELTVRDMQKELEARALNEQQLAEFLKWAVKGLSDDELDAEVIHRLFGSAVANIADGSNADGTPATRLLTLDQIETYQVHSKVPTSMPIPPYTMPFRIIKDIPAQQLDAFGWSQLQIVPWLRFVAKHATAASSKEKTGVPNMSRDPDFAGQVLLTISKAWEGTSQSSKGTIIDLLSGLAVIPTKLGLRKPAEAYFTTVKIFDDLPTIVGLQGVKEKLLVALGVRKTIELNVVFDRLLSKDPSTNGSKWSFADLVRYLVSVRDDIPKKDLDKLRTAPICPVVDPRASERGNLRLVAITEVYQPNEQLSTLGLPLLSWDGQWRDKSIEARFLLSLGLKPHPSASELAHLMQSAGKAKNNTLYTNTLTYFLTNYHTNSYSRSGTANLQHVAFLKADDVEFPQLLAPAVCFANPRAAILGFKILPDALRAHADKFGVLQDPHISTCAEVVIRSPPKSKREAIDVFGYLSSRLPHLDDTTAQQFAVANIVPVAGLSKEKGLASKWISPRSCYLGESESFGEIFDFVNFGEEANLFLLRLGAKHEPTSVELARTLVESPAKMLGVLQERKYLDLLRRLAENLSSLKSDKELFKQMKLKPFLLAYREIPLKKPADTSKGTRGDLINLSDDDDDELVEREVSLQAANHVVLVDAFREYGRFREHLWVPPSDDTLEEFYESLGALPLSQLIETDTRIGNPLRDQSEAKRYLNHLIERTQLFLYDYPKASIYHDARWIEKYFQVIMVDSISIRVSLRGYKVAFSEKRTVAITKPQPSQYAMALTKPNLYELSGALIGRLLKRPKKTDTMALEMILQSDLRGLKDKGYNVNRILRRKENEARVAEEQRQKQQVEERRQREEAAAAARKQEREQEDQRIFDAHANSNALPPPPYESGDNQLTPHDSHKSPGATATPQMPGGFGSPEVDSPQSSRGGKVPSITAPQSFLSRLGNQLGTQLGYNSLTGNTRALGNVKDKAPEGVTDPTNIQRNLTSAIQACRSHNSDGVFSDPTVTQVEEAQAGSYCDQTPAQNIVQVTSTAAGIKVYLSNPLANQPESRNAFQQETSGIERFAAVLRDLISVFNLSPSSIHIYHDPASKSIAFNLAGALFCNYHYFRQLHLPTIDLGTEPAINALSYWWITLCHELAHNLAKQHGAEHSFYMESFASEYFGRMMSKAMQY